MNRAYLLIFTILFIGMISATTTTLSSQTSFNVNKSSSGSFIVSYSIIENVGNPGSNGVSITGNPSVLIYSGSSLSYLANQTTNGTFTMNYLIPSNASGTILNSIVVDGFVLNINFNIQEPIIIESGCRLIELPHTTTFRIKQGETASSTQIKIKVSGQCSDSMSMTVNELTQMAKPMFLQGLSGEVEPGSEFAFSIGLDAMGVSTGTYTNQYVVSGTLGDDIFQKTITLSTIVTVGTSPLTEDTFNSLPQCTLESNMQLNNTYSLVCNYENPNIHITVPYNSFFEGTDVDESEGKFEYKVKPLKVGVTDFFAYFDYNGFNIGSPFKQEVRVSQGNIPLQGTTLNIQFYQEGVKKDIDKLTAGNVNILIKDSNTDSIISDYIPYLNGLKINSSFPINYETNYELIVDSPGYLSKTVNFNVSESPILINITPIKELYVVGDTITISTDVNASLLLNDVIISSPYTFTSSGNHTLKAVKEGYTPTNKTLNVKNSISMISSTPLYEDWKKGKSIQAKLSESTDWIVLKDGVQIASGTGDLASFEMEDYGNYEIKNGDRIIQSKLVQKTSSGFLGSGLGLIYWIIGIVVIGGGYLLFKGKSSSTEVGYG